MARVRYTPQELNNYKYTKNDVLNAVYLLVDQGTQIKFHVLDTYKDDHLFNLPELNDLVDRIRVDSARY